jgi:phosphoadenosine phosphosulfate reductase
MILEDKIQQAIELLKKHEKTAISLNSDGYYVAFSGGKDSQVIYELCKMAGVKFKAHFSFTTVDPPELLSFIKQYYPSVERHKPEKSMFKLIKENRSLPLKQITYCCRLIKEIHGVNCLVVNGIRKQESNKRKNKDSTVSHVCVMGKDKFILSIIIDWTFSDVWNFINKYIGYHCSLYDEGFSRIGCLFCPNATPKTKQKQLKRYPRFRYAYEKAIQDCIEYGNYKDFNNASEVFDWWISGKSKEKWMSTKNRQNLGLL